MSEAVLLFVGYHVHARTTCTCAHYNPCTARMITRRMHSAAAVYCTGSASIDRMMHGRYQSHQSAYSQVSAADNTSEAASCLWHDHSVPHLPGLQRPQVVLRPSRRDQLPVACVYAMYCSAGVLPSPLPRYGHVAESSKRTGLPMMLPSKL
jgi:hypothetical protein